MSKKRGKKRVSSAGTVDLLSKARLTPSANRPTKKKLPGCTYLREVANGVPVELLELHLNVRLPRRRPALPTAKRALRLTEIVRAGGLGAHRHEASPDRGQGLQIVVAVIISVILHPVLLAFLALDQVFVLVLLLVGCIPPRPFFGICCDYCLALRACLRAVPRLVSDRFRCAFFAQ